MIPACLELIRGAVSTRDLVPVLTHIAFNEGRVCGFNGRVMIIADAPEFKTLPSLTVPAVPFLAALEHADEDTVRLTAKDGRLRIKAGSYNASIPTGEINVFPLAPSEPKRVALRAPILDLLRTVRPFISEDASRPWSIAVNLAGGRMYATNNVIVVSVDLPKQLKGMDVVMPVFAVDELLRVGQEPMGYAIEEGAVTFFLDSLNASIRCTSLDVKWPDAEHALSQVHDVAKLTPVDPRLLDAVRRVFPLSPDQVQPVVQLSENSVSVGEGGVQSGSVDGFKGLHEGWYNARALILCLEHATMIDLTQYPRVAWTGDRTLRGVLVGVRR